MADLTFEQAVSTIVGMKDEIVRALGETFVMVGLSTTIAVIFGTLLGVLLFVTSNRQLHYNKPVNFLLDNLVNLMRAFPFVILMIAMIPATRAIVGSTIGPIAASLVLSVSGLFYFARLVEQNLREVPKGVIEAATAMGASPLAIVRKVLLNEARAGMVSSITVLAIGLVNLVVSFTLALFVALRSRGTKIGSVGNLCKSFWQQIKANPLILFFPVMPVQTDKDGGKDTAKENEENH